MFKQQSVKINRVENLSKNESHSVKSTVPVGKK